MSLEAAVDVGTNSALLLVAEALEGAPLQARLQKESICRLGKGVGPGGRVAPEAIERMRESLRGFRATLALTGARLRIVGMTEVLRLASNADEVLAAAEEILGQRPVVVTGEEEGRLVRRAVRDLYPDIEKLVVLDLGGGSLEIDNGKKSVSMPLGAVRLHEEFREKTAEAMAKHMKAVFREAGLKRPNYAGCTLVAVGGTATTLVAMDLAMAVYDGTQVEGRPLTIELIDLWLERLGRMTGDLRARLPGLSPGRADIIPYGLRALRFALEFLQPERSLVSDRGLRFGLLARALHGEEAPPEPAAPAKKGFPARFGRKAPAGDSATAGGTASAGGAVPAGDASA